LFSFCTINLGQLYCGVKYKTIKKVIDKGLWYVYKESAKGEQPMVLARFEWTYEADDENQPALNLLCEVEFSDDGEEVESFAVYSGEDDVSKDLPQDVIDAIEEYAREEIAGEIDAERPTPSWHL
jgi:hypothetical protein